MEKRPFEFLWTTLTTAIAEIHTTIKDNFVILNTALGRLITIITELVESQKDLNIAVNRVIFRPNGKSNMSSKITFKP